MLRPRPVRVHLEALEDRTLPATLVSPTILTYQDIDGDMVRVNFSKPVLTAANANQIFGFNIGNVSGTNSTPQKLNLLSLEPLGLGSALNLNVTVSVAQKGIQGDGRANVGRLTTMDQSLGKVVIGGDLGEYRLQGTANYLPVAQMLQVQSLGQMGPQDGALSLSSYAHGYLPSLRVLGNVAGAMQHQLIPGDSQTNNIGTLDIGGTFRGFLQTDHGIGTVRIAKDIDGSRPDLSFDGSSPTRGPGRMIINGYVDKFNIGGSLIGGTYYASGAVNAGNGDMTHNGLGDLVIKGDVQGGAGTGSATFTIGGSARNLLLGGSIIGDGDFSGGISSNGFDKVTIGGSIIGNVRNDTGQLVIHDVAPHSLITQLEIKGDVIGGTVSLDSTVTNATMGSINEGFVAFSRGAENVSILGDVIGGGGDFLGGQVYVSALNFYLKGSIYGGALPQSGYVAIGGGKDSRIRIDGSIIGGAGAESGVLKLNNAQITPDFQALAWENLNIGGSVIGGAGDSSGAVLTDDNAGSTSIKSIIGGSGANSGTFFCHLAARKIVLQQSLIGGQGNSSGSITVERGGQDISIQGSIVGGDGENSGVMTLDPSYLFIPKRVVHIGGNIVGGRGDNSARIHLSTLFTQLQIDGSVMGGDGAASGSILADGGFISDQNEDYLSWTNLAIRGSLIGGAGEGSGLVRSTADAGPVVISGNIVGGAGSHSGNFSCDGAVDSFKVLGSVRGGDGYFSGQIIVYSSNSLDVEGSVIGSDGGDSGEINVLSANVNIGGRIIGGIGQGGRILENGRDGLPVNITVRGGLWNGSVYSSEPVATATIGPIVADASIYGGGQVGLAAGSQRTNILGSIIGGGLGIGVSGLEPPTNQVVHIKGNVQGEDADSSGVVLIYGKDSQVRIDGSVIGGAGSQSGYISVSPPFSESEPDPNDRQNLSIGGSLVGGVGWASGTIGGGNFDRLAIKGSILGGAGEESGVISNVGLVAALSIGGDISGGQGDGSGVVFAATINVANIAGSIRGGSGENTGVLDATLRIESITLGHDLVGGTGDYSGSIRATNAFDNGGIGSVWIGGSIRSGTVGSSSTLGVIHVGMSIIGTASHPSFIGAGGFTEDNGIPSPTLYNLSVGKDISFTNILVGTDGPVNHGAARVGTISIGHNWTNTNLVVGLGSGNDFQFNTEDDIQWNPISPSVVDALFVQGTMNNTTPDTNYLLAGQFNSVYVNGMRVLLHPGSGNDDISLAPNVRLHEQFVPWPF